MSNATAISVMRYALQQYHYTESPAGSNKTKFGRDYGADGQPWCSYFVWDSGAHGDGDNPIAKANNAGDIQDWTVSKKGGSWVMPKTKSNKTKAEGMKKAKFGDIASFDFGANDMWRDHTALYIGDGYFIEGNTSFDDKGSQDNGGAVALKLRPSNYICSYARPKYKQKDFYKPTTPYTGPAVKLPEDGSFKWGDKGAKALQEALKWSNGYKLDPDGDFGSKTFAEVVIFQVANGLTPDGVFGKKSLDKMNALIEENAKKDGTAAETKPAETTPAEPKHPALFVPTQGGQCYDLSNHQGVLSVDYFKSLKKKGVACVILRSSYTRLAKFEMHEDAAFKQNIKNAHAAGLHVGIYHYSSAVNVTEAKKEAQFCLKIIKPFIEYIDLPVAFDCEFGTRFTRAVAKSLGRSGMGKIADGFLSKIKAAGYEPMLYANLDMLNNYMPTDIYKKYKIWIAQYNKTCDYKHPWFMWQYTSSGKVTGISGKVDVNRFASESEQKQPEKESTGIVLPDRGWFQKGDTGEDMKQLQELLNKKNKGSILPDLEPDGEFGEKTEEHVELFQDARHLTVDGQIGNKTLPKLQKATTGIIDKGINFLVSVARDNSFAYGTGKRAHHNGCYFCGTNITGPKKAKKGSRWEKTYCCNPFIHAGWAHGGGHKDMLKDCKKANAAGMEVKDWTKYGFEDIGKVKDVPFSSLKRGDVIITHNHVFEYTGGNWIVEASGGTWKASSIAHKEIAKKKYAAYKNDSKAHVMRYKG